MKDLRAQQLHQWLTQTFATEIPSLNSMNGDAGFRRYFRVKIADKSYIAVDAPSDKCNNQAFVDIAKRLTDAGILVPTIVASDLSSGFLCLSDLGDRLLAQVLSNESMADYYRQAIALLPDIASISTDNLADYDRAFIQTELEIFPQWLLTQHLAIELSDEQQQQLQQCFACLIENALEQPQVFMHRDFHSRNIMQVVDKLAVIDFQDAVKGPVSYDIVSLLRDCYVKWPDDKVQQLLQEYVLLMEQQALVDKFPLTQWQLWFDLMGLQRHIKAAGIFARLYHRDAKPGYLADIPLTLSYIAEISGKYPELKFLHQLVTNIVIPAVDLKQSEAQQ